MIIIKKIFIVAVLAVIIAMIFIQHIGKNELILGVNPTFPPFEYIDGEQGNEVVGFDIEIAKIIAKNYKKNLKIESMGFYELIPALKEGKVDMVMSALTITDERMKEVDFSSSYYSSYQVAIIRKDDNTFDGINTKEMLGEKKKISSRPGTTGYSVASEIATGFPIVERRTWAAAISELLNGNVDVVIIDDLAARDIISTNDNLSILQQVEFDIEPYGIAVKKGNYPLLTIINNAIDDFVGTEGYNRLVAKYIDKYE